MIKHIIIVILSSVVLAKDDDQMWHQDLSNDMKIGAADSGYRRVDLRCLEKKRIMKVNIELDEEFTGVIYTRGNFHSKDSDCFLKSKPGTKFNLRVPFDKCGTTKENNTYKNIIVIQHDDELIMPGDAAFALECDLGDQEIIIGTELPTGDKLPRSPISKISLADADPAGKPLPKHRQSTVTGKEGHVTFTPDDVRPRRRRRNKEEL